VVRGKKIAAIKANTSAYDTKTPHGIHGCADRLIPHGRAIDAFFAQEFDFMLADPPCGKCW